MKQLKKTYLFATIAKSFDDSHIKKNKYHLVFSTFYTNKNLIDNLFKNYKSNLIVIKCINTSELTEHINITYINENTIMIECNLNSIGNNITNQSFYRLILSFLGEKFSPEKDVNILNQVLFLFEDLYWDSIKYTFDLNDIKVGGGTISRRNLLSTC